MATTIFLAFIVVYAVLVLGHKDSDPKGYKLFWFGLLVSVLYASVYSLYPHTYLLFILLLTSLAILTQYFHMRAVSSGRAKGTKMVVDVAKKPHWEKQAAKPTKRRR